MNKGILTEVAESMTIAEIISKKLTTSRPITKINPLSNKIIPNVKIKKSGIILTPKEIVKIP